MTKTCGSPAQPERVSGLAPVCDAGSRVLLLGTFPSPLSRRRGMYYGNPQNAFWRLLCDLLSEPPPGDADEARALLLRRGIALWDVVGSCIIKGAADSAIKSPEPNDIPGLLRAHPGIETAAFTSVGAKKLYARLIGEANWPALPSPSPAYAVMPYKEKLMGWKSILTEHILSGRIIRNKYMQTQ